MLSNGAWPSAEASPRTPEPTSDESCKCKLVAMPCAWSASAERARGPWGGDDDCRRRSYRTASVCMAAGGKSDRPRTHTSRQADYPNQRQRSRCRRGDGAVASTSCEEECAGHRRSRRRVQPSVQWLGGDERWGRGTELAQIQAADTMRSSHEYKDGGTTVVSQRATERSGCVYHEQGRCRDHDGN